MTSSSGSVCAACGALASGKFCGSCGANLVARTCAGCGTPLGAGAQFCSSCGRAAGVASRAGERVRWVFTGALGSALIAGLLIFLTRGAPAPAAEVAASAPFASGAAAGGGPPPDISNMSPRERFDRLYNRVMTAAENGDEATVTNFSPMALSAYGMLDTVDADARYHAALIKLHTGDIDGATALGDTILANNPGHLFGYIVLGTVARFRKDDAGLSKAYSGFLSHYGTEMKAGRAEYSDHARSITDFKKAAEAARSPA